MGDVDQVIAGEVLDHDIARDIGIVAKLSRKTKGARWNSAGRSRKVEASRHEISAFESDPGPCLYLIAGLGLFASVAKSIGACHEREEQRFPARSLSRENRFE